MMTVVDKIVFVTLCRWYEDHDKPTAKKSKKKINNQHIFVFVPYR